MYDDDYNRREKCCHYQIKEIDVVINYLIQ